MKIIIFIFYTTFIFSQKNAIRENLFINLNKNEKSVHCIGCNFKKSEIIKVTLYNNSRFDSVVFYFKKIKSKKVKVKIEEIINIVEFEKIDLLKYLGFFTNKKIYLIFDKKRLYCLDNYFYYDKPQE